MRIRDLENWPPQWVSKTNFVLSGERGTLVHVKGTPDGILLDVQDGDIHASGVLIIKNDTVRRRVWALLEKHVGRPTRQIGDVEIYDA